MSRQHRCRPPRPAVHPDVPPAQVVPANPPTFTLSIRLRPLKGPSDLFGNKRYVIYWGPPGRAGDGTLPADGNLQLQLDARYNTGYLEIGALNASNTFERAYTIPIARVVAETWDATTPIADVHQLIARRLWNLGYLTVDPRTTTLVSSPDYRHALASYMFSNGLTGADLALSDITSVADADVRACLEHVHTAHD